MYDLLHFNQQQQMLKFHLHIVFDLKEMMKYVGLVDGIIYLNLYPKHVYNGFQYLILLSLLYFYRV